MKTDLYSCDWCKKEKKDKNFAIQLWGLSASPPNARNRDEYEAVSPGDFCSTDCAIKWFTENMKRIYKGL